MANYNPHEECIIGPEWFPSRKGVTVLDSDTKAIAYRLTAATSDDIETFFTFLQQAQAASYSAINLEIFDITDGPVDLAPLSEFTFYPGGDRFVAQPPWTPGAYGSFNGWDPTVGAFGPFWEALNSPTLTPYIWTNSGNPIANDELVFNYFGLGFDFAVSMADIAGTQTGRWVTRVRQRFTCAQYLDLGAEGSFEIEPYLWINGYKCPGPRQSVAAADGVVDIVHDWYYNPLIASPWTADDIDRFDVTYPGAPPGSDYWIGPNAMGWQVQPTGSSNNLATILQGQLIVESASVDPRLAIGSTMFPPNTLGWKAITLRHPDDYSATTLNLTPGREYMFLVRRGASSRTRAGDIVPSYLKSIDGIPIEGTPGWTSSLPRLDSQSHRPQNLGDVSPNTYAAILATSNTDASMDSQVYCGIAPLPSGVEEYPLMGLYYDYSFVNTEYKLEQEFTPVTTEDYGWVTTLVSVQSGGAETDLVITIRDRATDTAQADPIVITPDMIDLPEKWYKIGMRIPNALPTLTSGTQYYFDITSTTPTNRSWLVQVLNSALAAIHSPPGFPGLSVPLPGSYDPSWGGGIDLITYWTGYVYNEVPAVSATINVATLPTTPTTLTAEATEEACNFSYIELAWDVVEAPDCGDFGGYEIQRSYDQIEWARVDYITDIDVSSIDDVETRSNELTYYRIRTVRADGAASDWSDVVSATATQSGPGLIFTANAAPELTVGYQDIAESRVFTFVENLQTFQPQGRNYQLVYRELENRGVTFATTLRIRDGRKACLPLCDDPEGYGDDVFAPMLAIARAGLPYVCVRNESGNIWFAHVATPTGEWRQHGMERFGGWAGYTLDIEITEVTDIPSPVDATVGP